MEFGFKEILFGLAGVSMIAWAGVIGLWHTYMFPRFFKEDSSRMNVAFSKSFRESLPDSERAILRSGSGPHAAPWLHVIPYEDGLSLDDV